MMSFRVHQKNQNTVRFFEKKGKPKKAQDLEIINNPVDCMNMWEKVFAQGTKRKTELVHLTTTIREPTSKHQKRLESLATANTTIFNLSVARQ